MSYHRIVIFVVGNIGIASDHIQRYDCECWYNLLLYRTNDAGRSNRTT